jgi:hypothetical protein
MFVSTIKELGYEKYYDHIPYIHNVITSKMLPNFFSLLRNGCIQKHLQGKWAVPTLSTP